MTINFTFWLPAWYQNYEYKYLEHDFTMDVKSWLENNLVGRGLQYGYVGALKGIEPTEIESVKTIITPFTEEQGAASLQLAWNQLSPNESVPVELTDNLGSWSKNFMVVQVDFSGTYVLEGTARETESFLSKYHAAIAIADEVSALMKASIQLCFHSDWFFPTAHHNSFSISTRKTGDLGGVLIEHGNAQKVETLSASVHTYPAVFRQDGMDEFETVRYLLCKHWTKRLWSIQRFLKSIPGHDTEFESFIDLIFALESLFEQNFPSQAIRLASSIALSDTKKHALSLDNYLKVAFRIRNNIAHGAESYTGLEKGKTSHGEIANFKIFLELKPAVAGMIKFALHKIDKCSDPSANSLRINIEDIFNTVFES